MSYPSPPAVPPSPTPQPLSLAFSASSPSTPPASSTLSSPPPSPPRLSPSLQSPLPSSPLQLPALTEETTSSLSTDEETTSSLFLPALGFAGLLSLALCIIAMHRRATAQQRGKAPLRVDPDDLVAQMRQQAMVAEVMADVHRKEATDMHKGSARPVVPMLGTSAKGPIAGTALPKPLPLPSFRRWPSLASSRKNSRQGDADVAQLGAWLQQERLSEREIGVLRRELEELGHACESELRELEAREIAEMEEAAARLVAHERKEWAEGLQARQAERDRALLEREEWSAGQGGRAEQMRLADESIRVLLARLKELRKLRKEMLAGGVSRRLRSGTTTQSGPTAAATAATAKPTAAAQQRQRRRKVAGRGGVGSGGDAVKVKRLALSNYVDM